MNHLTLYISLSLHSSELTFPSSPLLTDFVIWPNLHDKDEEEDEEGEMMSDHMKDSEVKHWSFTEVGCLKVL